jgi:beta-phosphoglucomutase
MRALLWDMNGVLVDDEPLQERVWREALHEAGITLEDGWWREHFLGRRISTTVEKLWPELPPEQITDLITEKRRRYREFSLSGLPVVPGALELLDAASKEGLSQALVTGAGAGEMELVTTQLAVQHYFKAMICGADVHEGKPDPECFLLAAERLQIHPKNCWVIEDSFPGIDAAHAAGMRCVAITTSYDKTELHKADIVVDSLTKSLLNLLY